MRPKCLWRRMRGGVGALVLGLMVLGCESNTLSPEPRLRVTASLAAAAVPDPAHPARYRVRFYNLPSQTLVVHHLPVLVDALAHRGFVPASAEESPEVLVWIAAAETQFNQTVLGTADGPPVADNPDSIRYRNVAGLMGRYRRLVADDRNRSGEMMLGPDGEVIMTGDLASSVTDETDYGSTVVSREVVRRRNVLAVWTVATSPPDDATDDGEIWRVEVEHAFESRTESPDFSVLVAAAAEHLATRTEGSRELPLPDQP